MDIAERAFTVWLTGLPCSGKSTLARLLEEHLRGCNYRTALLDGDEVRERLSKGLGFSRPDRIENLRRIAYVCHMINQVNAIAIVAAVSPYSEARQASPNGKSGIKTCTSG